MPNIIDKVNINGTSYDIKDNISEYAISYDDCSVGTALVGSAVTIDPNYIPSGDVVMDYEILGTKLFINGFRFIGSGVKFVINSNPNSNAVGTGAADYMEI